MRRDSDIMRDVEAQSRRDPNIDAEIARDALGALKSELPYSFEKIKVVVTSGWIALEGAVEWDYVRGRARYAATHVRGVIGVTNSIELQPTVSPQEIRRRIEGALCRSAELDAMRITVDAKGNEVIWQGTVRSWAERRGTARVA